MQETLEPEVFTEVGALYAAVACSSIVLPLAARLADWETTRQSADVDDVILAWIASHVRGASHPRHFDA